MSVMPDPTDEDTLREVLDLIRRRSAPQGTMPTAQEEDVPAGPQPWQQTATDIAESAPGRFVRAAAEAVPKTLENVGTVAGMMVGAPLIAQGAKAIPGIVAGAPGVRNALDTLRQRPSVAPIAGTVAGAVVGAEEGISGPGSDAMSSGAVLVGKELAAAKALLAQNTAKAQVAKRFAENASGRLGALKDIRGDVASLAGESQPGMAEFVASRTGDIDAEIATRTPVQDVVRGPIGRLAGRGAAKAVGNEMGDAEEGFSIGAVPERPGGVRLGSGLGGFDPEVDKAAKAASNLAGSFDAAERERVREIVKRNRADSDGYIEEAIDTLSGDGDDWTVSDLRDLISDNMSQDQRSQKKIDRVLSYLDPQVQERQLSKAMSQQPAAIEGRAQVAAEAAAREAERAPATIDAAFSDPTDKARAATRASTLDLGGERGAAGFGHGVDAAKDVLENLRSYPKLRGMTMPDDPSMEMPKAIELLRARQAGVGNTWAERARSLRTGTPEEQKLFMDYLDLANNEARVNQALAEGKDVPKLPGDADFRDNYVKLMGAKRSLGVEPTDMVWNGTAWVHASEVPGSPAAAGKAYFDRLRPEVQNVQDEILNVAKGTGQLDAGKGVVGAPIDMNVQHGPVLPDDGFAGRVDYIPNILDRRLQDEFNPGMMSDTDAINWYNKGGRTYGSSTGRTGFSGTGGGAFRQTGEHAYEGSKLELAGDPIQRLAFKGAAVERKGMMNQFVDRLKPLAIDDTAPDFVFDPAIHGAYDMGGGNFKVFPRELALALSDAGKHDGGSMIAKGLNVVNNIAKQGLLKWNPSFQSKQILDDMAVGLFNVPLGKQGEFLRGVKNHASILMDEFGKINKGEFSPDIAAYRRSGRMAEIYESLIETTDEIKAFSKKTLGHELHGVGSKLDELGQIRETAIKSSLADIYMGMGATEERAISLASQVVGDYISSSKTGREIGAVLPMMKWYANAVKRLTAAAVEDPVTGKRNPFSMSGEELKRGASTSPWSKILPLAVSAAVWNSAVSGGEDSSFDGLLIPGTKQKIMFPGYGQLMGSVDNQKTMRPTAQGMLNRVSPGIQIPSIMLTGETLGGRRADPFRNVVSDKSSAKETARRGGVGIDNPVVKAMTPQFISDMLKKTDVQANPLYRLGIESGGNLTPRAQKSLETLSALAGISRRATSADTNGISENVLSALKSFSPVSVVDTGKQESIQFSRDKKDILREFLNASSSEDRRKAMKEWFDGGGTEKEFLQQLEAGQKEKFMFQSASPNVREMERKSKRR